ncbi:MAG TPA: GNAT family N-acetyltransferase [Pseudogracilibacillus sp.]|nr:GNAT family N-acetyltransferase [Pseudogracilibacillus sp.]
MKEIVGCVRVQQVDCETGEFGMLAVNNRYQGNGIASKLVRFAEQKFQNEQFRKMQLELLIPQEVSHPAKAFLEGWYNRIGYQRVYIESFETSYPRLARMLAIPCKFVVFQKGLR